MPDHIEGTAMGWASETGRVFVERPRRGFAHAFVMRMRDCLEIALPHRSAGGVSGSSQAETVQDDVTAAQADCHARSHVPVRLAAFRQLYASRDGRFVVFEDAKGHLTSVDSSRFA